MDTAYLQELNARNESLRKAFFSGSPHGSSLVEKFAMSAKDSDTFHIGNNNSSRLNEADDAAGAIPFTITTLRVDRDGDIVVPKGCQLNNYVHNPVIFFGHQAWEVPIAVARDPYGNLAVSIFDDHIKSTAYFDRADPDADYIYGKVRRGILSASSMAFVPIHVEPRGDVAKAQHPTQKGEGYVFHSYDLTEWSVVGIPSNAGAIRDSLDSEKSFLTPKCQKALGQYAAKSGLWWPGWESNVEKSMDETKTEDVVEEKAGEGESQNVANRADPFSWYNLNNEQQRRVFQRYGIQATPNAWDALSPEVRQRLTQEGYYKSVDDVEEKAEVGSDEWAEEEATEPQHEGTEVGSEEWAEQEENEEEHKSVSKAGSHLSSAARDAGRKAALEDLTNQINSPNPYKGRPEESDWQRAYDKAKAELKKKVPYWPGDKVTFEDHVRVCTCTVIPPGVNQGYVKVRIDSVEGRGAGERGWKVGEKPNVPVGDLKRKSTPKIITKSPRWSNESATAFIQDCLGSGVCDSNSWAIKDGPARSIVVSVSGKRFTDPVSAWRWLSISQGVVPETKKKSSVSKSRKLVRLSRVLSLPEFREGVSSNTYSQLGRLIRRFGTLQEIELNLTDNPDANQDELEIQLNKLESKKSPKVVVLKKLRNGQVGVYREIDNYRIARGSLNWCKNFVKTKGLRLKSLNGSSGTNGGYTIPDKAMPSPDVWDLGYQAAMRGAEESYNPYASDQKLSSEWLDGYQTAVSEGKQKRSEQLAKSKAVNPGDKVRIIPGSNGTFGVQSVRTDEIVRTGFSDKRQAESFCKRNDYLIVVDRFSAKSKKSFEETEDKAPSQGGGWEVSFNALPGKRFKIKDETDYELHRVAIQSGLFYRGAPENEFPLFTIYRNGEQVGGGGHVNRASPRKSLSKSDKDKPLLMELHRTRRALESKIQSYKREAYNYAVRGLADKAEETYTEIDQMEDELEKTNKRILSNGGTLKELTMPSKYVTHRTKAKNPILGDNIARAFKFKVGDKVTATVRGKVINGTVQYARVYTDKRTGDVLYDVKPGPGEANITIRESDLKKKSYVPIRKESVEEVMEEEAPVGVNKFDGYNAKPSAVVLASLHKYLKAAVDYVNEQVAKMDHPEITDILKGYADEFIEPAASALKECLHKYHGVKGASSDELMDHVAKTMETSGPSSSGIAIGEDSLINDGEIPPETEEQYGETVEAAEEDDVTKDDEVMEEKADDNEETKDLTEEKEDDKFKDFDDVVEQELGDDEVEEFEEEPQEVRGVSNDMNNEEILDRYKGKSKKPLVKSSAKKSSHVRVGDVWKTFDGTLWKVLFVKKNRVRVVSKEDASETQEWEASSFNPQRMEKVSGEDPEMEEKESPEDEEMKDLENDPELQKRLKGLERLVDTIRKNSPN